MKSPFVSYILHGAVWLLFIYVIPLSVSGEMGADFRRPQDLSLLPQHLT